MHSGVFCHFYGQNTIWLILIAKILTDGFHLAHYIVWKIHAIGNINNNLMQQHKKRKLLKMWSFLNKRQIHFVSCQIGWYKFLFTIGLRYIRKFHSNDMIWYFIFGAIIGILSTCAHHSRKVGCEDIVINKVLTKVVAAKTC